MVIKNNLTTKNIILSCIAAVSALFSILSLVFNIVIGKINLGALGSGSEGASGFSYLFGNGWDLSVFASILTLLVFLLALAIIALTVAVVILPKDIATYKKGIRLVTVANCVSALIYMIAGFVASSSEYESSVAKLTTAAYIPFIIAALLTAAYFVCDKLLEEKK